MTIPSRACVLLVLALAAGSCAVRSISDSGYRQGDGSSPIYRGELHDIDVLGDTPTPTDAPQVALHRGQRLLVVQSGALMPDQDMLDALAPHFGVGTMSGIPRGDGAAGSYRQAAARGGYDAVLCYWGVLESARAGTSGKALSWVPIAGFFVSDESQLMRIRLKLLVLDVASGRWGQVLPAAADDERDSSMVTRRTSDQQQVLELKRHAYAEAVRQLVATLMVTGR